MAKGLDIHTNPFLNLHARGFEGGSKDMKPEAARVLAQLYKTIRNEKTHAPKVIENSLRELQLMYPCEVIFFSTRNEERTVVASEREFLETLRQGPSSEELKDAGYRITLVQKSE